MFFSDLEENIVNNSLFKAISESKSIVDNIVNVIDEIIEIEEQIIAGPQGGI